MDSIETEQHNIIPVNIPNSIYHDGTLLFDVFPLLENTPLKTWRAQRGCSTLSKKKRRLSLYKRK
jgi:hypothetical protein